MIKEVWGHTRVYDRDFADNPTAQKYYFDEIKVALDEDRAKDYEHEVVVEDVEHFVVPLREDSKGEPYVKMHVPIQLFVTLYPGLDEGDFEAAKERARNASLDQSGVDTNVSGFSGETQETRPDHVKIIEMLEDEYLREPN